MTALQFISDPGHGWLQVPFTTFMQAVRAGTHFTHYSYVQPRTGMIYLEEDYDAAQFRRWADAHGYKFQVEYTSTDVDSFIRDLPSLAEQNKK